MTEETDYTRVRFHVQRGDGPDRRGEVTVEVNRSSDETDAENVRKIAKRELNQGVDELEDELDL